MDTTAGETFSKMSANDIGAPGGGANIIGPVEAVLITAGGGAASAEDTRSPTPARAAAATPAPAIAPTKNPVFLATICVPFLSPATRDLRCL
jgi:hypothetical protein